MLRINTLGPVGTDSYEVAKYLQKLNQEMDIKLYDSYDEIINNIDNLTNELILIPVAYRSVYKEYDWKDFNFQYSEILEIQKVFYRRTKTMVLLENLDFKFNSAIVQPATKIFIDNIINKYEKKISCKFASSKMLAYKIFKEQKYRYTICSEDIVEQLNFKVLKKFSPNMIWCLYRVKDV